MIKLLGLILVAGMAFSADEKPKASTIAIDKAIEAQMAGPIKAYNAYQKALEDANKKIIASLEKIKADLNDTKKGSMSLTERADGIKEIDEKIAEIRKNGLGERVASRRLMSDGELLGETVVEPKMSIVGNWIFTKRYNGALIFNKDGTGSWGSSIRTISWKYIGKGENKSTVFIITFDDDKTTETITLVDNVINGKTWTAGK